ncbi:MAG: PAS domain S-box protein, partial [Deltaproteobacteria bacterium]|nr:PAS domain S-box protein [Deltaproteobacteria bacterium]
ITDIRMPGMDGIEVLKRVKENHPDKEVIVVTAFFFFFIAIRALQLDASDFITKPVNSEALFVALERAKERYTTRKALHDYTALIEERWMDTAEELARTFDFQNNLIESSIDGILGCDSEKKIVTFNKSLEKMLGYQKGEVIGKMTFDQIFSAGGADQFREKLYSEEYGGENRLFLYEINLVSKSGDRVPVQLSATVLFDEGETIGLVAFFRDLRELRRLEQRLSDQVRLLHQDKMISLGRLAASVVHEINNPLAGILNYIRLMIKTVNRESLNQGHIQKFQGYLSLVESETIRCSGIVSNLLAFSRKSEMEFRDININDLLQKCIMLCWHKLSLQNINLRTNLDNEIPGALGDFNQIQQCIINLVFNAIDAMPDGGDLTIESSLDSGKEAILIKVSDNGCGIPREAISDIFDPFYTTKKEDKGIGLGLSTVCGIVDRHKGTIDVESESGKGSLFTIRLPLPGDQ